MPDPHSWPWRICCFRFLTIRSLSPNLDAEEKRGKEPGSNLFCSDFFIIFCLLFASTSLISSRHGVQWIQLFTSFALVSRVCCLMFWCSFLIPVPFISSSLSPPLLISSVSSLLCLTFYAWITKALLSPAVNKLSPWEVERRASHDDDDDDDDDDEEEEEEEEEEEKTGACQRFSTFAALCWSPHLIHIRAWQIFAIHTEMNQDLRLT